MGFHNAKSGLYFPSYGKIVEAAHCARSTIAEAIKALEDAGSSHGSSGSSGCASDAATFWAAMVPVELAVWKRAKERPPEGARPPRASLTKTNDFVIRARPPPPSSPKRSALRTNRRRFENPVVHMQ